MIDTICPHCKEATAHKVVRQNHEANLLWCQSCYRVSVETWDFAITGVPILVHPQLGVDFTTLDGEHRSLVDLIAEIEEMAPAAEHGAALQEACRRLLADTAVHLRHEEELLERARFPALDDHRRHHAALCAEMDELAGRLCAAPPAARGGLVERLRFCLVALLAEDITYKDRLAASEPCRPDDEAAASQSAAGS